MPDEIQRDLTDETPMDAPEPETEPTEPEEGDEAESTPGPLEEGGKRFNAIYAQNKAKERENAELRERIARLEGAVSARHAPPPPQQPQERFYTEEELDALVQAGHISQTKASAQLAYQYGTQFQRHSQVQRAQENRFAVAKAEINAYMSRVPGLTSASSPEFRKVAAAAYDIADDLNLPIEDPRVQRRALREAFGPLDRLQSKREGKERERQSAGHAEVRSGAGAPSDSRDPLKSIPAHIMEEWKRKKYTREDMLGEAPYVQARYSREKPRR